MVAVVLTLVLIKVDCTAPLQPAPGSINQNHAPMFLVGGSADTIVAPGTLITPLTFNPAPNPVIYGIQKGAGHFEPTRNGGGIRGYLTAWMRYHLMGDENAEDYSMVTIVEFVLIVSGM